MSRDLLYWIDVENFGLNHETDPIIEIGAMVTDLDCNPIEQMSRLVWSETHAERLLQQQRRAASDSESELVKSERFVLDMHTRSGLYDEARRDGGNVVQAQNDIAHFLIKQGLTQKDPMCGSSVHFDREALRRWMPRVDKVFGYRIIDVSSLKELCARYNPRMFEHMEEDAYGPDGVKAHRVLGDIMDSKSEFKWYIDNFLFVSLVEPEY